MYVELIVVKKWLVANGATKIVEGMKNMYSLSSNKSLSKFVEHRNIQRQIISFGILSSVF